MEDPMGVGGFAFGRFWPVMRTSGRPERATSLRSVLPASSTWHPLAQKGAPYPLNLESRLSPACRPSSRCAYVVLQDNGTVLASGKQVVLCLRVSGCTSVFCTWPMVFDDGPKCVLQGGCATVTASLIRSLNVGGAKWTVLAAGQG